MLDVSVLGIGGMMPLPGRPLSAALIRAGGETILWDCGEGTQVAWRASGWPFRPTGTILLSHLHADHVAGLPGVLFQIAHSGREQPVTIYGPPDTRAIVGQLLSIVGGTPFELRVIELDGGCVLPLTPDIVLSTLALRHRVACLGYRLDLPRAGRFDADRARELGVDRSDWSRLQRGETVDGVAPRQVMGPERRGLRLSLITDTSLFDGLVPFVADSDLLICEAMYADDDAEDRALQRGHMTARQSARLAVRAGVQRLLLTHVSPSVTDLEEIVQAARHEYPGAELAAPAATLTLAFDPD
ncbi:MAG TPA: ribonuclease Z [Thermomicrobiales bacterium]|nr:ribonuclease Z [Thermomicrobiales bacterium]